MKRLSMTSAATQAVGIVADAVLSHCNHFETGKMNGNELAQQSQHDLTQWKLPTMVAVQVQGYRDLILMRNEWWGILEI